MPTRGGRKANKLCPCAIQLSASARVMTWALESVDNGIEPERIQRIGVGQLAVDAVTLQAPRFTLSDLVLQQRAEEALGGPPLAGGLLGELGSQVLALEHLHPTEPGIGVGAEQPHLQSVPD